MTGSSYSYQNGDRIHHYSAELREVEDIQATRLKMLGLVLNPTRYKEEADDRGILIVARVELDAATDAALEREINAERDDLYFDVLRVGVGDTPLKDALRPLSVAKARFWPPAHLLRLVAEAGDDVERQRGFMLFQPELSQLERKAAATEEAIDALVDELQAAEALSDAAITRGARAAGLPALGRAAVITARRVCAEASAVCRLGTGSASDSRDRQAAARRPGSLS